MGTCSIRLLTPVKQIQINEKQIQVKKSEFNLSKTNWNCRKQIQITGEHLNLVEISQARLNLFHLFHFKLL